MGKWVLSDISVGRVVGMVLMEASFSINIKIINAYTSSLRNYTFINY